MKDKSPSDKVVESVFPKSKSQKSQLCVTKLQGKDGRVYSFITTPCIVRSSMTHTIDEVFEREAAQKDASVYSLYQDSKYNSIDQDSNSFKILKVMTESIIKNISGVDQPHSICSGEISHSGCYFDASELFNNSCNDLEKSLQSSGLQQNDDEKIEALGILMNGIFKISPLYTNSFGKYFASLCNTEIKKPMISKILSKKENEEDKIKSRERSNKLLDETFKKNAIEMEGNLSLDPSKNIVIFSNKSLSAYVISRLQESGCIIVQQEFYNVKGSLYKKGDMKLPMLTNKRDGDDNSFIPDDIFSNIGILT